MPRLGDDSAPRNPTRPTASAYPDPRGSFVRRFFYIMIFTLILRNLFFTDYRSEEIGYLRSAGKSDEEIDKIIPKTSSELIQDRKKKLSEYEQLKLDVKMLKEEVALLKSMSNVTKLSEALKNKELDKNEAVEK